MAEKQNTSSLKKTFLLSKSATSKNSNIISNTTSCEPVRRKSSVEALEEEGYTIGRLLGEGSYSKVKAAMFQGREIAVKILTRAELSKNFESKFLPRELDMLSRVKHPNIVHVYKIYGYPTRIYIFMELIQRGDLLRCIWAEGRLAEFQAHKYFKQIVSAVLYLHSLNIAHRDLKCENIMINDMDEVKIIDFGFCRLAEDKHGRRVLSQTFCGSTGYASPEVLQGIPYNPMMYDVWSLGCVLFIMVTGNFPFDESNLRKMVSCQLRREFEFPRYFTGAEPIKDLISHMLEPDVTRRANMKQVSQSSWLKQTTIDSRQGSSENKDDSSDVNPTFNQCRCTHTVPICMTHRLQSSSAEYNCRNASDDSE